MAKRLQLRRGTTTQHDSFTGAEGEVTIDTNKDTVVVHDGSTAGGAPLAKEDWLSVEPHIIPGVLYPAWSGLLDNHTGYTFTDSSASARTITSVGDVYHSGDGNIKGIGSTSMRFNSAYLSMADSADWHMAGEEFTLEYWFRLDSTSNFMHFGQNSDGGILRGLIESTKLTVYFYGAGGTVSVASTTSPAINTWYHVAIVRNNTGTDAINLYLNGTLEDTVAPGGDAVDASVVFTIGNFGTYNSQLFPGYMDEFRIVKGTCVYTGAFTPPTALTTTGGTYASGTNVNTSFTAANTKLLLHSDNGGHSGAYGTAQADGRKYYYTDIKGSKPIKDPRIGAHFGSQRHKTKSLQLLEQETATHGKNVYSVDGREWIRGCGTIIEVNDGSGNRPYIKDTASPYSFIEITGYFSDINIIGLTDNSYGRSFTTTVDGGSASGENTSFETSAGTPLGSRYVDAGSVANMGLGATLGIHTLKLTAFSTSEYPNFYGIELIAQDTTSTTTKSQIQIPSQNVVSYGKKFSVSGTPHYDPFNGFTSGTDISGYIDEATSLGMSNWKVSSTWYRPFNGGRVVKWVDSSGTIKTSVTMMPPNAQNAAGTASNAIDLSVAQTNDDTINFNTGSIDFSLLEIAKQFHWREFGNGSANAGTLSSGYADASMLDAADNIAYVMDDGLTSLSAADAYRGSDDVFRLGLDDSSYFTFIGSGISVENKGYAPIGYWNIAENLPYGTHILKTHRNSSDPPANTTFTIDGFSLGAAVDSNTNGGAITYFNIHQPKRPPIPEDAVVIADYMLMADFVAQGANGLDKMSKGVRVVHTTRDTLHDCTNGSVSINSPGPSAKMGMGMNYADFTSEQGPQLTYFGDAKVVGDFRYWGDAVTKIIHHFDGATTNVAVSSQYTDSGAETTSLPSSAGPGGNYYIYATKSSGTIGVQTVKSLGDELDATADDWLYHDAYQVATPIHTSSHYQTFETPFLHELVGGDRSMEQNNLIVTPDGKSWDEVTRDTSYLGNACVSTGFTGDGWVSSDTHHIWTEWRGLEAHGHHYYNKLFAIAYDRLICLEDGQYRFIWNSSRRGNSGDWLLKVNDSTIMKTMNPNTSASDYESSSINCVLTLKRGDYVQGYDEVHLSPSFSHYHIERIK